MAQRKICLNLLHSKGVEEKTSMNIFTKCCAQLDTGTADATHIKYTVTNVLNALKIRVKATHVANISKEMLEHWLCST